MAHELHVLAPTRRSATPDIEPRRRCCNCSAPQHQDRPAVLTFGVIAMVLLVPVSSGTCSTTRPGAGMFTPSATIPRRRELSGIQTQARSDLGLHAGRADLPRSPPGSPSAATARSRRPRPSPTTICRPSPPTVIGGISLFGGRGSILGTLFGAMIVGVVSMGLNMLGADPQWKVLSHRRADHRRRGDRPMDQKGFGMTCRNPSLPRAAWSSAMAASPPSTMPTSTSIRAKSSPS